MKCYALHIEAVLRRPVESGLHAPVGVMDELVETLAGS